MLIIFLLLGRKIIAVLLDWCSLMLTSDVNYSVIRSHFIRLMYHKHWKAVSLWGPCLTCGGVLFSLCTSTICPKSRLICGGFEDSSLQLWRLQPVPLPTAPTLCSNSSIPLAADYIYRDQEERRINMWVQAVPCCSNFLCWESATPNCSQMLCLLWNCWAGDGHRSPQRLLAGSDGWQGWLEKERST